MAASLTNDLAHLLTDKGVNADIQDKFGEILVTNVRLFSLMAESRAELKLIFKEPLLPSTRWRRACRRPTGSRCA